MLLFMAGIVAIVEDVMELVVDWLCPPQEPLFDVTRVQFTELVFGFTLALESEKPNCSPIPPNRFGGGACRHEGRTRDRVLVRELNSLESSSMNSLAIAPR